MAINKPTEGFAWDFDRVMSSLSTLVNGGPLHMKTLVEGPTIVLKSASRGVQNAVSRLKRIYTRPEGLAPQEVPAPGPSPEPVQMVTDTTPDNPPASESGAGTPGATRGENGLFKAIRACRKRTGLWITFFVVGVVSLVVIVVPGLTLGLVTGQLPWGIALSGTIVTVCGFYSGPVYTIISAGETEESRGEEAGEEMV